MFKRSDCCALTIGGFLLLLAAALMAWTGLAAHHKRAPQSLRMAQTLTALQADCLTCHSPQAQTPVFAHPAVSLHSAPTATAQADLDAQLYDLGRRIEALPDRRDEHHQEAVAAFLHTYDETRSIAAEASPRVVERALWRLAEIESLVQALEHQASPYRWNPSDGTTAPPDSTVLSAAPPSPGAAVADRGAPLGECTFTSPWVVTGERQHVLPQEIVYATHRRGPPAGLFLESM